MSAGILPRRILILDSDANDRDLAFELLAAGLAGVVIDTAGGTEEATRLLGANDYDLVVADRTLSSRAHKYLEEGGRNCPVIILAGPNPEFSVRNAISEGAYCVLPKASSGYMQLSAVAKRAMDGPARSMPSGDNLVDRLPIGVFAIDREGRIVRANSGAADALGFKDPADVSGQPLIDMLESHPAQLHLQGLLDGQRDSVDLEASLRRSDGENWWVRLRLWPSREAGDQFEGTLENITEYKKTEADLGRQAEELGRSNVELEQFAYVVSHDLQEPLGLIRRYAELLTEDAAIKKNKEATGHIGHVIESSQRMQTMIDAILEYSRIETRGTPFEPVDLAEVMETVVGNLRAQIDEAKTEVRYRKLPTVQADRNQMIQLFQNLVSNAVKFRAPRRSLKVSVSATEQSRHWHLKVQDNGIGMDPEQRERIFGMFQRLHSDEEYPGNGIGLAICRGIVRRHGGEIWVDTVPGEGSTFHLTLSKAL